jgi:mannitol-1-phosphate/altronate dehydrogenase
VNCDNQAWSSGKKLCIIDMDNVPNNGDRIYEYMNELAAESETTKTFLATQVVFFNTMVNRITFQREGSNGLVPRCEPTPAKALVVLDPHGDWPIGAATGVIARPTRAQFVLATQVVFFNTMVDRITSQREGSNGLVPRCEPSPAKALVVLDPHGDWPIRAATGVVVRSTRAQLDVDIALKLRVANGTHTAIARHCCGFYRLIY